MALPCPACGADLREGARFCVGCGAPQTRACPGCERPVEPSDRFCVARGHPLGPVAPTSPVRDPVEQVDADLAAALDLARETGATAYEREIEAEQRAGTTG